MNTTVQRNETAAPRALEMLGISEAEERVYRWLLGYATATTQDLAQALSLTPHKAQQLLVTLETKGLATHTPERPRRYIPVAPDIAVEAMILRHQKGLEDARLAAQELQKQVAVRQPEEREQIVELLASREIEAQIFERLHESARHEIVTMTRLPMRVSSMDIPFEQIEQSQRTQRKAHARGVHFRTIVDAEFLAAPGALRLVRADMKAGEEVRVIPHLPFKMILADRYIGLAPLNLEQPDGPSLLVRSSALLDAFHILFEVLWERAVPVSSVSDDVLESDDSGLRFPEGSKDLLPLMAAGLNDKTIAHELDISTRSLERRVAKLMQALGTRTRFQTGWYAALSLPPVDSDARDS